MKSKVLLVSKFYYRRGGACVYVLNLERILLDRGHEVAVFAMDYGLNEPSRWSGFFAPEVKFFGRDAHLLPAARRVLGWRCEGPFFGHHRPREARCGSPQQHSLLPVARCSDYGP